MALAKKTAQPPTTVSDHKHHSSCEHSRCTAGERDRHKSSARSMTSSSNNPEAVVQRQLDAFNSRDIAALLAVYADDAEMFEHPAKLLAHGSTALRERFETRFEEPNLHATLLKRIVIGNTVIDHESVARTFPEGPGSIELVMIYEVKEGRIATAWLIAGPRTLGA
jgi:hypothetical protein